MIYREKAFQKDVIENDIVFERKNIITKMLKKKFGRREGEMGSPYINSSTCK